jgi:hypothetical protein
MKVASTSRDKVLDFHFVLKYFHSSCGITFSSPRFMNWTRKAGKHVTASHEAWAWPGRPSCYLLCYALNSELLRFQTTVLFITQMRLLALEEATEWVASTSELSVT